MMAIDVHTRQGSKRIYINILYICIYFNDRHQEGNKVSRAQRGA